MKQGHRKPLPLLAIAMMILLISTSAFAQEQPAVTRTELQRHTLSTPGHEALQVRVDFAGDAAFGMHTHPGEEIIYVLEGEIEYTIEGFKPVRLKPGEVLFIPAGKAHAAKNTGKRPAAELATYIVEQGKPLVTIL